MTQVHAYESLGKKILLDVPSGSVHLADELFFEIVKALAEGRSKDEITETLDPKLLSEAEECFSEIELLKEEGSLFSEEERLSEALRPPLGEPVVKALCLHVAHACNLACRYCFAGEGEYHGPAGLMPLEVGKQAFDYLVKHSGRREHLEVDFFGGEPLLNWKTVKELVAYGRELEARQEAEGNPKRFRFTLTTNAVLLNDEIMDFCDREMDNVVLSIDGRRSVHDEMRPFRDGSGSYDVILEKMLAFAQRRREKGLQYYVRGTYTRNNPDFSNDVLHLAELGFDQISVEPVVAPASAPYAIRKEDVPQLLSEYESLAYKMQALEEAGKPFQFFHYMIDLSGGPCIYKRVSGCGSGTEYLAVTPQGELYPCHQFVGNSAFCLGDVKQGITNAALVEKFGKVNVFSKSECRNCFARYYCSGGCAANAFAFTGSVNGVYEIGCSLQKKRIETAIALKAIASERREAEE